MLPLGMGEMAPKKANIFAWRGIQNRLASLKNLQKRYINCGSTICRLCCEQNEDSDHLFVKCYVVTIVWKKVCCWCRIPSVLAENMRDLLNSHKLLMMSKLKKKVIQTILLATCWELWKARNALIFQVIEKIFGETQMVSFMWIKNRAKKSNLVWRNWASFDIDYLS
ncbi:putative reverse transcriptase zinc-binding domain-containing protein [Helianthus debilis subsp. tardiflorus]